MDQRLALGACSPQFAPPGHPPQPTLLDAPPPPSPAKAPPPCPSQNPPSQAPPPQGASGQQLVGGGVVASRTEESAPPWRKCLETGARWAAQALLQVPQLSCNPT